MITKSQTEVSLNIFYWNDRWSSTALTHPQPLWVNVPGHHPGKPAHYPGHQVWLPSQALKAT
jgi:hypothetical protein